MDPVFSWLQWMLVGRAFDMWTSLRRGEGFFWRNAMVMALRGVDDCRNGYL